MSQDTITIHSTEMLRFQRITTPIKDTDDPTKIAPGNVYWTCKVNEIHEAPAWIKKDPMWALATSTNFRDGKPPIIREYAQVHSEVLNREQIERKDEKGKSDDRSLEQQGHTADFDPRRGPEPVKQPEAKPEPKKDDPKKETGQLSYMAGPEPPVTGPIPPKPQLPQNDQPGAPKPYNADAPHSDPKLDAPKDAPKEAAKADAKPDPKDAQRGEVSEAAQIKAFHNPYPASDPNPVRAGDAPGLSDTPIPLKKK